MLRHGCRFIAFMFTLKLCLKNQFDFGARFLVRFCRVTKMNKRAPWMARVTKMEVDVIDCNKQSIRPNCSQEWFKHSKLKFIKSEKHENTWILNNNVKKFSCSTFYLKEVSSY